MTLEALMANLAAVRSQIAKRGWTDAQVKRLADKEDAAVFAIARHPAASVDEMCAKLLVLFDVEARIGLFQGCADLKALKASLLTDMRHLRDKRSPAKAA
jgi:hypothetical protein